MSFIEYVGWQAECRALQVLPLAPQTPCRKRALWVASVSVIRCHPRWRNNVVTYPGTLKTSATGWKRLGEPRLLRYYPQGPENPNSLLPRGRKKCWTMNGGLKPCLFLLKFLGWLEKKAISNIEYAREPLVRSTSFWGSLVQ